MLHPLLVLIDDVAVSFPLLSSSSCCSVTSSYSLSSSSISEVHWVWYCCFWYLLSALFRGLIRNGASVGTKRPASSSVWFPRVRNFSKN